MPRLGDIARGWDDVAGAFAKDERTHKAERPKSKPKRKRPPRRGVYLLFAGSNLVDVVNATPTEIAEIARDTGVSFRAATSLEITSLRGSADWKDMF